MKEKELPELKTELKVYKILLRNYALTGETVSSFLKEFGLESEEDIIPYILDGDHGFELSRYGHRHNKIKAYNGKGIYQGQRCTLGASHSK